MKNYLGHDALIDVKDINASGDSYRRVMQKYIEANVTSTKLLKFWNDKKRHDP